jgi:hypothetical protein
VVRGGRKTPEILYSLVFFFAALVLVVLDGERSSSSEDNSVRSETSDSDMMKKNWDACWDAGLSHHRQSTAGLTKDYMLI